MTPEYTPVLAGNFQIAADGIIEKDKQETFLVPGIWEDRGRLLTLRCRWPVSWHHGTERRSVDGDQ